MDEVRPAWRSLVAWVVVGAVALGSCLGLSLCGRSPAPASPPASLHE